MIKSSFFGTRLVRGTAESPVATIVLFAPRLDFMAARSDSAGRFYNAFRGERNSGTWVSLAGVALLTGALVVANENEEIAIGFTVAGIGGLMFGTIRAVTGRNDFARAVWWYNRELR